MNPTMNRKLRLPPRLHRLDLVRETQTVGIIGANTNCMNRRDRVMGLVSAAVTVINSAYRELKVFRLILIVSILVHSGMRCSRPSRYRPGGLVWRLGRIITLSFNNVPPQLIYQCAT